MSVDFSTGVITDETTGKTYQPRPCPPSSRASWTTAPAQIPEGERCGEMNYKIALIRGDGIGPEVVGEAVEGAGAVGPEVRPQLHL